MSRLQLWQGGTAEGRLVLFLPGCPDSRWAALPGDHAARRAGVRLVAVNRPGYGDSPPAASTHVTVADDLVAVADDLGAERFGLLGMSAGGPYALACAARHPDRVSSVVTVACPGDLSRMEPPAHRDGLPPDQGQHLARIRSAATVEDAVELLRPEFEAHRSRTLRELPSAAADEPSVHQTREALACPDGYLRDAALMLRPWQWDPAAVSCPVQVVHGALDEQASVRNAHWLAAAVPGARSRILPRTDHLTALHDHWDDHLGALRGS